MFMQSCDSCSKVGYKYTFTIVNTHNLQVRAISLSIYKYFSGQTAFVRNDGEHFKTIALTTKHWPKYEALEKQRTNTVS